ncbi:hypothetical protein BCV72DRAFT_241058 [Rhizopus microsporus var. microsporus]|uniref:Uncharacterized protein n=1 Tax=Rhizopus microsporus var. microsporus TaxID=86635 RepID=A0A1X0R6K8_RHIZD|nr:hypothetical protein BCV72DRAFT_241058 [Rhizopus microsporus var. microsporus]
MKIFDIEEFDNISNATLDGSASYSSSTSNQLVQTSGLKTTTTGSLSGFKSGISVTPMIKLRGISHLTEEERRERYRTRPTGKLIINPMIKLPGPASRSSPFADQRQQRITSDGSNACSIVDQTEQKATFSTFGDPSPFIMQLRKNEGSSTNDTTSKLSVSNTEFQKLLNAAKATIACFKNVFKETHQKTIDRLSDSIMPLVLFKETYAMRLRDKIEGLIIQLKSDETNGELNKPEQDNLDVTLKDFISKTEEYSLATRSLEDAVSTLVDECEHLVQALKEDLSRKKRARLEWDDINSQLSERGNQVWKKQRTG